MERRKDDKFHLNLSRELGGINAKLENMHDTISSLVEQVKIANGRTRKLENWKSQVTGQMAILASFVSVVVTVITILINKFL